MKISIVVPVFNDVRVKRALESILAQQHDHELEIIVVDAGSTDGTFDILKAYKERLSVLISEPDEGVYDGMNKGIQRATGDIVGILNADDQYNDSLVIRDVAAVFCSEAIDVCYGNQIFTTRAGRVIRYWKAGRFRRSKWYFGWMPPHPTFFVRRRVYERYGAFDLQYPIAADYELMLRFLFKHRTSVKYLNRVMVNMAPGGLSNRSVSAIVKANIEVARAWKNNNLQGGLFVPILKPASKVFQYMRRP